MCNATIILNDNIALSVYEYEYIEITTNRE